MTFRRRTTLLRSALREKTGMPSGNSTSGRRISSNFLRNSSNLLPEFFQLPLDFYQLPGILPIAPVFLPTFLGMLPTSGESDPFSPA